MWRRDRGRTGRQSLSASKPSSVPSAERARLARHHGQRAESLVARWLEQRGYAIVATNLRIGYLEIDIVARQGPVIAIVEVRTRGEGAWTTPFGSVDPAKRTRLRRAGERLWQRRYKHDPSVERLRFDVASVKVSDGKAEIEYAVAAF